jgi:cardiolipin synthase (CMP-forming)
MVLTHYHPEIKPSLLSKVTTAFQIVTILLVLMIGYSPTFQKLSMIAIYGTAGMTILSGAHYIHIGTRILNEKK